MAGARLDLGDVPYVRQFLPELAPPLLRAVAALSGCPPPPEHEFVYGELGAGYGDTLATLAAAHPRARFVGLDLRADHVAYARELAARGELRGLRFEERDLEGAPAELLPPCHYLAAHGLLTWITPEKRCALFELAGARLEPGGLLYLGYNAQPGWSAVEPLRRFMLDAAARAEGSVATRVGHALSEARALRDGGAAYFTANPSAGEILDTMLEMGVPYAAHEFFGAHWQPLYFEDVAREAEAHGLRFVGRLPLRRNYRDLAVPPSLAGLARAAEDRRSLEGLAAFANNEFFRQDVFVKGPVPRTGDVARTYLETTRFGTLGPRASVRREVPIPGRTMRFDGPVFEATIEAVASRGRSLGELTAVPALAAAGADALRTALHQLLLGGDVVPLATEPRSIVAPATSVRVPSAHNQAALARALEKDARVVVASTVAGTGVPLSTLHAVALRALTVAPEERSAWLRGLVNEHPLRLRDHGETVAAKDDLAAHLEQQVEAFRAERLPKLLELGIAVPG